ncbi:glucosaminidase domain-containing protein [Nonlabens xiamenensis]|uniref:glucosaminidase domain-containing protein n=1 Tax=Nonlabens xiamenensis TaxID=2341043 RepID=UPI000F614145|nr:glucosaminidase domain-containing protein [Nonlabens xiamenensis]
MKTSFKGILILLMTTFILVSCGGKKRVVTTKRQPRQNTTTRPATPDSPVVPTEEDKVTETTAPRSTDAVANYIYDFKDIAVQEMKLYGIPASITLAQGILESGSGRGRLATEANNHFGIKCHRGWTGGRIYHDDDEDQECFRTYNDAKFSYRDHSLFLRDRKRYAGLFKLDRDDYEAWAKGLRAAGYATDKRYPQKLISLIERYELYKYDAMGLGKKPEEARVRPDFEQVVNDGTTHHVVVKGDTLYRLSKKYNLSVDELKRLNNLNSNDLSIGQKLKIK